MEQGPREAGRVVGGQRQQPRWQPAAHFPRGEWWQREQQWAAQLDGELPVEVERRPGPLPAGEQWAVPAGQGAVGIDPAARVVGAGAR